ncbi:MAG: DUF2332 domain-containing protein [Rhodospirillales bacterium]
MAYSPEQILHVWRRQANVCTRLGSPLYERLLSDLAQDIAEGGAFWRLLEDWDGELDNSALPLRVAGALHYLALKGDAPELAALFPSCGGTRDDDKLQDAARTTLTRSEDRIRPFLARPPQTNEVARSGILLGGFLEAARLSSLKLRPREVGSSAGLNQCWDLFNYEIAGQRWGQQPSELVLRPEWHGGLPALQQRVSVASRGGCDLDPLDIRDPDVRLRLQAYVWPDQELRLANLRAALKIALTTDVRVEQEAASRWTRRQLADRPSGECIVIYHSIVRQYFPPDEGAAFDGAIAEAGATATPDRPVAWLRVEQEKFEKPIELRLTMWPDGKDRLLAHAHPHGAVVNWFG